MNATRFLNVFETNSLSDETVLQAARDHNAYGWSRNHGRHAGPQMTPEQRALYDREYFTLEARKRGVTLPKLAAHYEQYFKSGLPQDYVDVVAWMKTQV